MGGSRNTPTVNDAPGLRTVEETLAEAQQLLDSLGVVALPRVPLP